MSKRHWTNLALFLLFTSLPCVNLARLNRYPDILGDKLDYYRQHHDQFDTLLVGSSYMHFGVDPRALDAALRDEGLPSSTFNLAISGLMGHEIDETLRLALSLDRNRTLKRVIIDLRPLHVGPNPVHANTEYEIWWHSPYQTLAVLETLWRSNLRLGSKLRYSAFHGRLMVENHLPLGSAHQVLRNRKRNRSGEWFWESMREYRGYEPLFTDQAYMPVPGAPSNVDWTMILQRGRMLKEVDFLRRQNERLIAQAELIDTLELVNVRFWRRQSERLLKRRIQPLHAGMPSLNDTMTPGANALLKVGAFHHYVSFNNPHRFPEYFEVENRFEFGHLNHAGATLFSYRLGKEIAARTKGHPSVIESAEFPRALALGAPPSAPVPRGEIREPASGARRTPPLPFPHDAGF